MLSNQVYIIIKVSEDFGGGEGYIRERRDFPGLYLRYRISSMREVSKPEEQMEVLIYLLTNLLI